MPNSARATLAPKMGKEVAKLRQCLNEVSRSESRRRRKIESLREKAKADDISRSPYLFFIVYHSHILTRSASSILAEAAQLERNNPLRKLEPVHFEPLFEARLSSRYSADRSLIPEESEAQSDLCDRLREANNSFNACRKGEAVNPEREQALQALENAYLKHREIMGNLDVGRKFYNDLAKLLVRFRDDSRQFVYNRRVQAGQFEVYVSPPLSPSRLLLFSPCYFLQLYMTSES